MENECIELRFNNDQLRKLVTSAEILFQHFYDLVSPENKFFIDQWFCYKKEYDETCSKKPSFDVNENVPKCSVLPQIDEVSENEKLSSSVSSDSRSSESCLSIENSDDNKNYLIADEKEEVLKSCENPLQSEADTHLSQIDSDLLEYMTEFKLFTDGFVTDWFKTFSFNTAEIREYLAWLENKEYKRVWTNIYNNARKKSATSDENFDQELYINNINNMRDGYISLETSQISKKAVTQNKNQTKYNTLCRQCSNENRGETIDQQIRHLQEVRHVLLCTREHINIKLKKEEMNSSYDFKRSLKVDVAFEIIDSSIEMKNRLKLGYDIQDLCLLKDEVDTIIADCLRTLSLHEVRNLFITYLKNVIDMRKSSSECDKQILKLDSEISNQKFLIWRLYMMINENKRSYENQCLTLHKEFEQKLQLMGKTTTDESNDSTMESITGLPGRKLLSIIEKNDAPESSHSERDIKDSQNMLSVMANIPPKSLKTSQNTPGTSSGTKVTRSKKKIIIQTQKH